MTKRKTNENKKKKLGLLTTVQLKTKYLKRLTGKTIKDLEVDWLTKIKTIEYKEIKY